MKVLDKDRLLFTREPQSGIANPQITENRKTSARLHAQPQAERMTGKANEIGQQRLNFSPTQKHLSIQLAQTAFDHIQAFQLLHEQYLSFGYITPNANRIHLSPWNLKKTSHTLTAFLAQKQVIGTITCLQDSTNGLPADLNYPHEMKMVREQNDELLEMGSFAIHYGIKSQGTALKLLASAVFYSRYLLNASAWVCTVNPRHASFYKRVMLFKQIGSLRTCSTANGAESVLLFLNLRTLPRLFKEKYSKRSGERNLYNLFFNANHLDLQKKAFHTASHLREKCWPQISRNLKALSADSI